MMAKVTVTVCDKCGKQEGVSTYELRKGDKRVKVDLCVEDGKPLDDVFKSGSVTRPPGRPRAAAKRTPRVTTLDEIEKMKQPAKKAVAKKAAKRS